MSHAPSLLRRAAPDSDVIYALRSQIQRLSSPWHKTRLAGRSLTSYGKYMITIRFPDTETKRRALGFLAGRFSFTTWASGEVLVPDSALPALAHEGISFNVEGPATYGQAVPALRNASSTPVQ